MTGLTTKTIRAALVSLAAETAETGNVITKEAIREKLGVVGDKDYHFLRDTIKRFIKSGELRREGEEILEYVPEAAPPADSGEGWARAYRAARVAKGSFDTTQVMKLAVLSPSAAGRYLRAMVDIGYLEIVGRNGSIIKYMGTTLLKNNPAIPPEPKRERVPFIRARAAMAELNSLFVMNELSTKTVRQKVLEQLEILQREFGKDMEDDC